MSNTFSQLYIHCVFAVKYRAAIIQPEWQERLHIYITRKFTKRKFHWQDGYGAFSNSRSQIDSVVKYIVNQKEHHTKKTFREEYLGILKAYAVEYDEKYIFHDLLDG